MNATAAARDAKGTGQRTQDELAAGVARFLGEHPDSGERPARIARLETGESSRSSFNPAAALLGPLWAASRGLWTPFWLGTAVEVACLTGLVRSWWSGGAPESPGPNAVLLAVSVAVLLAARAVQGAAADWMLWRAWKRSRHGEEAAGRVRPAERGARGARRARPRRGLHLALRHPGRAGVSPDSSPPRASSSAPPRSGSTAWSTGW